MDEKEFVKYNATYDSVMKGILKGQYGTHIACKIINDNYPALNVNPDEISYIDTELNHLVDIKTLRCDVLLTFGDDIIDIEPQREKKKDELFKFRMTVYAARLLADRVKRGEFYKKKKVVLIAICGFDACGNKEFRTVEQLTDIYRPAGVKDDFITIIYIQLPYLKKCDKMKSKEFYEMLMSNYPGEYKGKDEVMDMAISEIKRLNSDEAFVEILERIEEDKKIEKTRLNNALEQGLAKGIAVTAKKMKEDGLSIEMISKYTNLSKEEIEKL